MALDLPPISIIRDGNESASDVHRELTSIIAGHGNATTTYKFYEDLDSWLGPWGEDGYLIGYGKKYNVLFTENKKLNANATTRQWVWKTTIKLQEAIRDFVVNCVRTGRGITERELKHAAFSSHPQAYSKGGLATVVLVEPLLLAVVISIPGAEFIPSWSDTFGSTVLQALNSAGITIPQLGSNLLAAVLPAHSGSFRNAARRDMNMMLHQNNLGVAMQSLQMLIQRGKLDNLDMLDSIIMHIGRSQYDQIALRNAQAVLSAARKRRNEIAIKIKFMLQDAPLILRDVKKMNPNIKF